MRVLLATDGSEAAAEAMSFLETLPLAAGTEVRLVSVVAIPMPIMGSYPDAVPAAIDAYAQVLDVERDACLRAAERAKSTLSSKYAVTCEVREGDPAHEILEAADEVEADLLVLGSRGMTGIEEFFLGSVARNVAKHCRRPVVLAKAPQNALRSVVFATDGSEHARHAATYLANLPLPQNAVVTIVHCVRPQNPYPGILPTDPQEFHAAAEALRQSHEKAGEQHLAAAESILTAAGKTTSRELRIGDPAEEIVNAAQAAEADLVVAGARGVSMIKGLLVGSVAERLLRQVKGSVLLVH
jgi:nucleotide-binding universal stress UspA family protein